MKRFVSFMLILFGTSSLSLTGFAETNDEPTAFSNLSLTRGNGQVSVNLGSDIGNISLSDSLGVLVSVVGSSVSYLTDDVFGISVSVTATNKIPFFSGAQYPPVIAIQGETIIGDVECESDVIKIGTSVTTLKTEGEVVFSGSAINLTADTILIESITISSGAEVVFSNDRE